VEVSLMGAGVVLVSGSGVVGEASVVVGASSSVRAYVDSICSSSGVGDTIADF
jgi:hypothetical protein